MEMSSEDISCDSSSTVTSDDECQDGSRIKNILNCPPVPPNIVSRSGVLDHKVSISYFSSVRQIPQRFNTR